MKPYTETERLIIREIELSDVDDMFEMDSDPEVRKYIDQNPNQKKEEITDVINFIRNQYEENGIGRWAVVDKETDEMLG